MKNKLVIAAALVALVGSASALAATPASQKSIVVLAQDSSKGDTKVAYDNTVLKPVTPKCDSNVALPASGSSLNKTSGNWASFDNANTGNIMLTRDGKSCTITVDNQGKVSKQGDECASLVIPNQAQAVSKDPKAMCGLTANQIITVSFQ